MKEKQYALDAATGVTKRNPDRAYQGASQRGRHPLAGLMKKEKHYALDAATGVTKRDPQIKSTPTKHTTYSVSKISAFVYYHRLEDGFYYLEHKDNAGQEEYYSLGRRKKKRNMRSVRRLA